MSISVGSNNAAALSYAGNAYGSGTTASKTGKTGADTSDAASAPSSPTQVTLSDEAKAYLAQTAASSDEPLSLATVTANARSWFDEKYASLGITSAMLDGQVAVDLTGQTRATLSAIANNELGEFSKDEMTAAAKTLQARFDSAMAPSVVVARHTGDYASLYTAASDYLDQAGADEKATPVWRDQKQAVLEGLAAAKASFGKAPDTGNADDPVRSLLDRSSVQAPAAAGSDPKTLATNARAMLDAQASSARDNGTELVFSSARKFGQQADFSAFDNRSLAIMALNSDASFSVEEASAAKAELRDRSRSGVLSAFDPASGGGAKATTESLLQQYSSMSSEEKQVLGFNDDYANRIMQNYRTVSSIQNTLGSGAGLAAYL